MTDTDISEMTDGIGDWAANPYASRMVEYTPYAVALGMKFVSSSAGRGEILLPWRADLLGQDGTDILAPGVLTALIDHTCGLAIMASFGFEAAPATLDLRAEAWDVSPDDPVAAAQAAFTLNRRSVK